MSKDKVFHEINKIDSSVHEVYDLIIHLNGNDKHFESKEMDLIISYLMNNKEVNTLNYGIMSNYSLMKHFLGYNFFNYFIDNYMNSLNSYDKELLMGYLNPIGSSDRYSSEEFYNKILDIKNDFKEDISKDLIPSLLDVRDLKLRKKWFNLYKDQIKKYPFDMDLIKRKFLYRTMNYPFYELLNNSFKDKDMYLTLKKVLVNKKQIIQCVIYSIHNKLESNVIKDLICSIEGDNNLDLIFNEVFKLTKKDAYLENILSILYESKHDDYIKNIQIRTLNSNVDETKQLEYKALYLIEDDSIREILLRNYFNNYYQLNHYINLLLNESIKFILDFLTYQNTKYKIPLNMLEINKDIVFRNKEKMKLLLSSGVDNPYRLSIHSDKIISALSILVKVSSEEEYAKILKELSLEEELKKCSEEINKKLLPYLI